MNNIYKEKVLIACSGGPDSMALLDMAKDKYDVYVAHINYHKRDSADRDERIVRNYCKKNNIPLYVKDYKDFKGGNFQDKARVFRYEYFASLVKELKLKRVLVAHHKDDLIETYLLQLKRGGEVSYYGLKKEVTIKGIKVKRPLLKYFKDDLLDYCHLNKIKYGIDESNLGNDYARNKIRHEVVEKMTKKEKNALVKEIKLKNNDLSLKSKDAKKYLNKRTKISIKEFLNYKEANFLLREMIKENISTKEVNELIKQIKEAKSLEILIGTKYLVKEYDYLEVYPKENDYKYVLDKIKYIKTKHFNLTKTGTSKEGVTLKEDDFPITIRNYREGDSILMRYGTKKINRFFIDNKIASKDRKMWPIMLNRQGSVILVPKIGCDKNHYSSNHNLYMIKL